MKKLDILPGNVIAEITSADISSLLNILTLSGIQMQYIQYCDDLSVRISVGRKNYQNLVILSEKHGAVVKRKGFNGIFPIADRLKKRPVLILFLLAVFLVSCYVPSRIFFLRVEGNTQVPERYILEVAAECGIDFGAKRRLVRSEMMKNRLLEKIPQLQWAGINTSGCTAVISVREKTHSDKQNVSKHQVSSIVATRDGIIQSCTVQQGNALCTVGQAVKAGQVLVSGYLDCGIVTKTTQADAEIKALTFRNIEVISPHAALVKNIEQEVKTRYALRIGKKLIKFYKDSGNLDTTCGKIYLEEYVRLPGGFCLPIAVVKETEVSYIVGEGELPVSEAGEWIKDFASNHLKNTMISGEIISADAEVTPDAGVFCLQGRYACMEIIGQIRHEEFIPKDDEK
ncbi:MAG: sporulation protein YqfD [Oscillospiraceae bacterium]|nr:sporulation protein YqfD [Oscillospiraceae bacterium]